MNRLRKTTLLAIILCVFLFVYDKGSVSGSHHSATSVISMIGINFIVTLILLLFVIRILFLSIIKASEKRWNKFKDDISTPFGPEARKLWEDAMRAQAGYGSANKSSSHTHSDDELKKLHRELLKKYHPDFAQGEDDKKFRTDLTAKINRAYAEKDFQTLNLFK
jgi:hypothetical protein